MWYFTLLCTKGRVIFRKTLLLLLLLFFFFRLRISTWPRLFFPLYVCMHTHAVFTTTTLLLDKRRFFTRPRTRRRPLHCVCVCYCSTFCGDRGDLSPTRELNEVRRWSVNENDRCPGKTTAAAQRVNLFPDLYILLLLLRARVYMYVMCACVRWSVVALVFGPHPSPEAAFGVHTMYTCYTSIHRNVQQCPKHAPRAAVEWGKRETRRNKKKPRKKRGKKSRERNNIDYDGLQELMCVCVCWGRKSTRSCVCTRTVYIHAAGRCACILYMYIYRVWVIVVAVAAAAVDKARE